MVLIPPTVRQRCASEGARRHAMGIPFQPCGGARRQVFEVVVLRLASRAPHDRHGRSDLLPAMRDQTRKEIHERIFRDEAAFHQRPHLVEPIAGDHFRMRHRIDESDRFPLAAVGRIFELLRKLLLHVSQRGLQFGCAKIALEREQALQLIPRADVAQLNQCRHDAAANNQERAGLG